MAEQMSNEGNPRRDSDEMSVASDFSIIPESYTGQEYTLPLGQNHISSDQGSLTSEHLRPSVSAEMSFGKVLFQNVQATYTIDSDIAVSYVLTSSVNAKSADRIGLYRVGFGSPQEYLAYQWAPTPSKDHTANQLPLTVVFKASAMPKDVGEFFQFCYVTHDSQIVGVSTPFQLLAVGSSNVMGVDDGEDGMVVVCTKESVLHDKINKLTEEKDKITRELSSARETLEEKQGEIDDKLQQLNMCQHHLQALEAKMKKETSEKCELMGRVGQVVEEKGHLEDRVKTLERNLDASVNQVEALTAKVTLISEEKGKAEEDALQLRKVREQLEHALQKCQTDLSTAEETIQTLRAESEHYRSEMTTAVKDLEFWTSSAASDKDEKNSLAIKYSTINEELINKLEELDKSKKLARELEERLSSAVVDLTSGKDSLTDAEFKLNKAEEEKIICEERLTVVNQDNDQLKVTIQQLKNKVESLENVQGNDESGREAAERIASDLSGRLQAAKAEYHSLALTNLRLVKKIKKLRQSASPEVDKEKYSAMALSMSSQGSSWLNVEEGLMDNGKGEEPLEDDASGTDVASNMLQSCTSDLTTCSNCSHSTQLLSEAVHRKMEDIVRELSLQIQSLKMELKARQQQDQTGVSISEGSHQQEEVAEVKEELQEPSEVEVQEIEEEQQQETPAPAPAPTTEGEVGEAPQTESMIEAESETPTESNTEQQVLYSNSFLPAQRTAPVFLPERGRQTATSTSTAEEGTNASVRPSAPSPTPSMLSQRGQTPGGPPPVLVVSTSGGSSLVVPRAHLPVTRTQPAGGPNLPPPLLPETTPTARQAAVMSQFSSQPTSGLGHESDDDDFHSTSDNDDTSNITNDATNSLFECPMCGLSFQPGAIRLLEEHINSHLEHVCPVCSMAFQRNYSKKFEEHVHAHFSDEVVDEDNPLDDPSGPWGSQFRATRLLEID